MYDVAIIGGSISGCTAATLLGRAGLSVVICDKAVFPRPKACGEGLADPGVSIARALQLIEEAELSSFTPFRNFVVYAGKKCATISHEHTRGIAVERAVFDAALWSRTCKTAGVTPLLQQNIQNVNYDAKNHIFTLSPTAGLTEIKARAVIIADGSGRLCTRTPTAPVQSGRIGLSAHYTGECSRYVGSVHIIATPRGEYYLTPLSDNRVNLALLTTKQRKDSALDLLRNAPAIFTSTTGIPLSVTSAEPPRGRTFLGNFRRSGLPEQLFLVGDAVEQFDPIGGMGMTHALYSASVATAHLLRMFRGKVNLSTAINDYERERLAFANSMRSFTRFTYATLRGFAFVPAVIPIASTALGRSLAERFSPNPATILQKLSERLSSNQYLL